MTKTLVTHNGYCHTDDVLATVILCTIFGVKYEDVVRTRNEAELLEYAKYDNCIIYDVGHGDLDHHGIEGPSIGDRKLSSIGLVWRKYHDEILDTFHIDDTSWANIDRTLIAPIDISDNGGELNPFNYAVNGYSRSYEEGKGRFDTFVATCRFVDLLFTGIINMEIKATNDRKEFAELPVTIINGKTMKLANKMYSIGRTSDLCDGIITKDEKSGHYKILMLNGNSITKKGLKSGDIQGVIFTHPAGFCGETTSIGVLMDIL